MKKIFTVVLLLMCVSFASAQTPKVKYQGEVQTGVGVGVGTFGFSRAYLQTIQGIRAGEHFSAGLGIGANVYFNYIYDLPEVYMPIFLNAKGYLPVSEKTNLFLSLDLGYSVGLTEGVSGMSGLMVTPAVGASFKTRNNKAINLSLGFDCQRWSSGVSGIGINDGAFSIKIGYQF